MKDCAIAKRKSIPDVACGISKAPIWGDAGTSRTGSEFTVWSGCIEGDHRSIKERPRCWSDSTQKPWKCSDHRRLRERYALPMLLSYFHMVRSSYYYQQAVMNKPDKYLPFREQITSVFHENRGIYGYRRIHLALKRKGIILSEKSNSPHYERRGIGCSCTQTGKT